MENIITLIMACVDLILVIFAVITTIDYFKLSNKAKKLMIVQEEKIKELDFKISLHK